MAKRKATLLNKKLLKRDDTGFIIATEFGGVKGYIEVCATPEQHFYKLETESDGRKVAVNINPKDDFSIDIENGGTKYALKILSDGNIQVVKEGEMKTPEIKPLEEISKPAAIEEPPEVKPEDKGKVHKGGRKPQYASDETLKTINDYYEEHGEYPAVVDLPFYSAEKSYIAYNTVNRLEKLNMIVKKRIEGKLRLIPALSAPMIKGDEPEPTDAEYIPKSGIVDKFIEDIRKINKEKGRGALVSEIRKKTKRSGKDVTRLSQYCMKNDLVCYEKTKRRGRPGFALTAKEQPATE